MKLYHNILHKMNKIIKIFPIIKLNLQSFYLLMIYYFDIISNSFYLLCYFLYILNRIINYYFRIINFDF